jgi:hypothetical protein
MLRSQVSMTIDETPAPGALTKQVTTASQKSFEPPGDAVRGGS